MSFLRVTDKNVIRAVLDAYLKGQEKAGSPHFIPALFSRENRPGGIIYEGTRPTGAFTDAQGERSYTLANGDTKYLGSIAQLRLSGIEYVELLREFPLPTSLGTTVV